MGVSSFVDHVFVRRKFGFSGYFHVLLVYCFGASTLRARERLSKQTPNGH